MTITYLPVLKSITTFRSNLVKSTLIFLLSVIVSGAFAQQQKPGYSLLWKISGKGLAKPSYVFGTMHVKDNRAFGFSDSVMLAMQSCPLFALEVHPDTIVKQMFATLKNRDSTNSLRKILSKEEYEAFAKRFEARNGYPPGDISPIQAESMMQPVKDKPDDKKAFVDAYLFGIARGMGKSIYGLENASEQYKYYGDSSQVKSRLQDILGENEEDGIEETEEMTRIYSTGDLKKIFSYLGDEKLEDSILVARNNVMLNSIIMHMGTQPIFSAVGVAHLPGANGLITLLRNAGYTVTPVTANFTGVANKYNTDYTNLKWKTFTNEDEGYAVDFPFEPVQPDLSYEVKAVVYPDLANDMFLGTYAILKGSKTKNTDQAIAQVIKNLTGRENRVLSNKIIWVSGLKGREVIVKNKKQTTVRYRLVAANNFLYCIYAGNDLASINSAYANKFFNSFKTFKPSIKPDKEWITYKNDTAGFSVSLPMQPVIINQQIPSPQTAGAIYDLKMYLSTDSVKLINYLVRYNDFPKGMYLADKSKSFDNMGEELKSKGAILKKSQKVFADGIEGRELYFSIKDYNCKAQYFVRGNRIYMFLKQNLNGGSADEGFDFFKTLKLTPNLPAALTPYNINDNFKAATFEKIKATSDTVDTYASYLQASQTVFSTNPFTGGVFGFEHAKVSKYYRAPNQDSLYRTLKKQFVTYADSQLKDDTLTVNGIHGHEYVTQNKYNKAKERNRVFIDNGDIFYFVSHVDEEELFKPATNQFYSSLIKTGSTPSIDLSASKAALITTDLLSTDTTIANYALGALSYYKFDKSELPQLYSALHKSYPNDTLEKGTRPRLVRAIAEVKDEGSIKQLVELFNTAGTTDEIKGAILSEIAAIEKNKGLETYFNLISTLPRLKTDNTYQIFRPMYDSLEYTAANYTRVLPLIKNPAYRRNLLSVTLSMVAAEQKNKYAALVKSHFNELTEFANTDLEKYFIKDTTQTAWTSPIYNYLQLMAEIKGEPLTDSFTNTVIKRDTYTGLKSEGVITRLANHLPVNQLIINKLLDSLGMRYEILEALNKNGQLAKAAPKYRTPAEFAKAALYKYVAMQDDGDIEHATLLGTLPEKTNTYYVFKFNTSYSDTQYIAICGPYKTGTTKLDFSSYHVYSDWDEKKSNWQLQAKKMIPALKEQNISQLKGE